MMNWITSLFGRNSRFLWILWLEQYSMIITINLYCPWIALSNRSIEKGKSIVAETMSQVDDVSRNQCSHINMNTKNTDKLGFQQGNRNDRYLEFHKTANIVLQIGENQYWFSSNTEWVSRDATKLDVHYETHWTIWTTTSEKASSRLFLQCASKMVFR